MSLYQDMTAEELAERNGASLLAHQLQAMERKYLDAIKEHAEYRRALSQFRTRTELVGQRAIDLRNQGRKTVKLDDLIEGN